MFRPCPFCGSKTILHCTDELARRYYAECSHCGATGGYVLHWEASSVQEGADMVTARWNQRTVGSRDWDLYNHMRWLSQKVTNEAVAPKKRPPEGNWQLYNWKVNIQFPRIYRKLENRMRRHFGYDEGGWCYVCGFLDATEQHDWHCPRGKA